jgi:hypothetical protein
MCPNYPQGYPHPVDFLCVDMWAKFPLYDQAKKIPEKLWAHFLLYGQVLKIPQSL